MLVNDNRKFLVRFDDKDSFFIFWPPKTAAGIYNHTHTVGDDIHRGLEALCAIPAVIITNQKSLGRELGEVRSRVDFPYRRV